MCRFLIVNSNKEILPLDLLTQFAAMCKKSIAPDGETQRDGFGVSWKENNKWKTVKSISPIWKDQKLFNQIPETRLFMAHARSASFSLGKDNLEFNQPFTDGDLGFVFNGTIRKMKTSLKLEGEIGSQKLFSLIKLFSKKVSGKSILEKVRNFILAKAESIDGMNIGFVDKNSIHLLCQYSDHADYFTLFYFESDEILIISSEEFGGYQWRSLKNREIKKFELKN